MLQGKRDAVSKKDRKAALCYRRVHGLPGQSGQDQQFVCCAGTNPYKAPISTLSCTSLVIQGAHHFSCPIQYDIGTNNADCATCASAAMTAVSWILSLPRGKAGGSLSWNWSSRARIDANAP